ncbi:lipoprotein-34 precursor (NlpB) [Acinetobacter puyangensis]|uniref:lipoprotein-34 precursor (NlpB) n=1 Tax=Acinetobacter puyangensis TaxID=1096779 RepID=UPI003A4DE2B2
MQLRLSLTLGLIAISLVGCARFGVGNGSLDYKHTQTLEPLQIPADLQMRPQQSLYPAPKIDPKALEQAPNFSNKHGNRFEMPRPTADVSNVNITGAAPSRPQLVTDGNGVPLIKVDGATAEVWKYVVAATSTANIKAAQNSKVPYQLDVEYEEQPYRLRLTPTGSSNTLGIYDANGNFIDAKIATDLLSLIYQNWPA